MNTRYAEAVIPPKGEDGELLLEQIRNMQRNDVAWKSGRAWSLAYSAGEAHDRLLHQAHELLAEANYLNPFAFKSLEEMEQEVVHMTIHMLHGPEAAVGVMSGGGTESILLAMFAYRQRAARLHPHITHPEVVVPVTIHPAFDKAALLFGLKLRKAAVDASRSAIPEEMEKQISRNTILIAASAPSYPNGVLDPVSALAGLAVQHKLPLHVDACIGGFMLPWLEKMGYALPLWDFRVPGVTSVSADVHKFGFGAKGASVIAYRSMDYLHHQFMVTTDFPGGIYISPTLMGTRPGGPIAAAWAGMRHLGEDGYLALAKKLMEATARLRRGLEAVKGIEVIGNPCMNILSYTTTNNTPDIYVIADRLESGGWLVDRQQFPPGIHLTILPTNVSAIDQYLSDLRDAVDYANAHPEATAEGNAAIYGLMARIPFRGVVEKNIIHLMEQMYGGTATEEELPGKSSGLPESPAWMGRLNRILATVKRWKGLREKEPGS